MFDLNPHIRRADFNYSTNQLEEDIGNLWKRYFLTDNGRELWIIVGSTCKFALSEDGVTYTVALLPRDPTFKALILAEVASLWSFVNTLMLTVDLSEDRLHTSLSREQAVELMGGWDPAKETEDV
jgi:hypothetical protein